MLLVECQNRSDCDADFSTDPANLNRIELSFPLFKSKWLIADEEEERPSFVKRISLFGVTRETCGTSGTGADGRQFEVQSSRFSELRISDRACLARLACLAHNPRTTRGGESNDEPADWPLRIERCWIASPIPTLGVSMREGGARGERVSPRVSRGDPSGRDLVESFRNSRGRDHTIAGVWSVPAFHFAHASVDPSPSDNGCCPAPPSCRKGTAYDMVTGIDQCRRLRVGKSRLVVSTDLARSGCKRVGQVQGQAMTPSLSHFIFRTQPHGEHGSSAQTRAMRRCGRSREMTPDPLARR